MNRKALMRQGLEQGFAQGMDLQETLKNKAEEAQAAARQLKEEAEAQKAQLEQQATEARGLVESKTAEVKQQVESTQAEVEAEIAQNQAEIDAMGPNVVNGRVAQGFSKRKDYKDKTAANMKKFKDNAERAGRVAKDEAKRVHADKVSSMAGDLAGLALPPKGGLEANTPMQSSSGAYTVGGRRRRRKSRKKRRKSRKKSRKSRRKRRRRSRRRRRKRRGGWKPQCDSPGADPNNCRPIIGGQRGGSSASYAAPFAGGEKPWATAPLGIQKNGASCYDNYNHYKRM